MDDNDWRVHNAILRDERDNERLAACAEVCALGLDALIPLIGPLEHPCSRWRPDDLVQALSEQLANIEHERRRINTPMIVLDDLDDDE